MEKGSHLPMSVEDSSRFPNGRSGEMSNSGGTRQGLDPAARLPATWWGQNHTIRAGRQGFPKQKIELLRKKHAQKRSHEQIDSPPAGRVPNYPWKPLMPTSPRERAAPTRGRGGEWRVPSKSSTLRKGNICSTTAEVDSFYLQGVGKPPADAGGACAGKISLKHLAIALECCMISSHDR